MKVFCEKCGHEDRSEETHSHYFAILHEIWQSLPDDLAARFPDTEALRGWCLCREGYCDASSIVCDTEVDCQRVAALCAKLHKHSITVVNGKTLQVFIPRSQSYKAMGAKLFASSKTAVLSRAAAMIGIYDLAELAKPPKRMKETPSIQSYVSRETSSSQNLRPLFRPPDTAEEYMTHLKAWLPTLGEEGPILHRSNNELALRSRLGIDEKKHRKLLWARIAELAERKRTA